MKNSASPPVALAPIAEGPVRVHIRWLIKRDLPEILAIEAASFAIPWVEEDFTKALRGRNVIGMACELGEQIVGYMIYELHTKKLNVLKLAVDPTLLRRSIGAQLIAKLLSKLSNARRDHLTITVRETNLAAQLFLKKQGFKAQKIVRRFYDDTREDGIPFVYALPSLPAPTAERATEEDGAAMTTNRIARYGPLNR